VLNQTYQNIEYIVVDGGSTDTTIDLIKRYEGAFNGRMCWISEPDNGMYDAMNKGIRLASGDIIGILNSDDRYAHNDVLNLVYKQFKTYGSQSVYGDLFYVDDDKPYRYWRAGTQRPFASGWMPPHPAFFVKKIIYENYGLFRLDCGTAADYELMLRFIEKQGISTSYIPKPLVLMQRGGRSGDGIKSRLRAAVFDDYAWEINGLHPAPYTFLFKKLSKIKQFVCVPLHSLNRI
jgi:glycosyltransferase involved in cell wall biosynthesis